jgi:stalled ribosome rescue protein Dom34
MQLESGMEITAMIWIDERKAVLRLISAIGERTLEVYSQEASRSHAEVPLEPTSRLRHYLARVIAAVGDAGSVMIAGPGEVKGELGRLVQEVLSSRRSLVMMPITSPTERQIAARARDHQFF